MFSLFVQRGIFQGFSQWHMNQAVELNSKLNCEVLWDDFAYEVRWAVAGDSIVLQLVARLEDNEYMSFGLSGDASKSSMVGGDVVVAWVDKESLKGYAQDYYLDAKSQCSGGRGSCPDEKIAQGTGSVRLLNAALVNGYSIVTFQRSLKAQDELDNHVFINRSQPIIWAIGPLNSRKEVSYHSLTNRDNIFVDFGRAPQWNCPTPESTGENKESEEVSSAYGSGIEETKHQSIHKQEPRRPEVVASVAQIPTPAPVPKSGNAWEIPPIKCFELEDGVFYAQMGPTGGKRGYSAITGHVGWGISWYINGLLIPEINVVRGRTYTFIVEGGLDPETPARYHPFYITDDPVGGYQYKTPEERANIQIFAGAVQNKRGEVRPTGIGRLCNWTPDPNQPPADEFTSFGAYQRTLRLECDPGNPGIIQWTVDKDTPDTVYYQCYTHRYLGWKINVLDECENEAASELIPSIAKPPNDFASGSANHEIQANTNTRMPYGKNETNLVANDFSNVKAPERVQLEKLKNEQEPKTFYVDNKVKERTNPLIFPALINPDHSYYSQTGGLQPQPHQYYSSLQPLPKNEQAFQYSTLNQLPDLSLYSVNEEHLEGKEQHVYQNFRILPMSASQQDSNAVSPQLETYHKHQIAQDNLKGNSDFDLAALQKGKNGIKFSENNFINHQIFKISTDGKFNSKQPTHVASGLSRRRKPISHESTGFQQRPFLGGPPAKPGKRTTAPTGPLHPAQHLNHRLTFRLNDSATLRKYKDAIQAASSQGNPTLLESTQPAFHVAPFATNTGFNPDSIKIEGGFKPILGTGASTKSVLIDRRKYVEAKGNEELDKPYLNPTRETPIFLLNKTENSEVSGVKELHGLENRSPEKLEPIFIPSHPDDSGKKVPQKSKKKPVGGNGKHRSTLTKGNNIYVRMRANANMIRRPLYPENGPLVPPPLKMPRFRQRQDSYEAEEASRNFDVIRVNEDDEETGQMSAAGNILDLLKTNEESRKDATDRDESGSDEMAMANEKSELYLPLKVAKFVAYDGKEVKTETAPMFPKFDSSTRVSKLPQFVPYEGVVPPLTEVVNAKNLAQLMSSKLARDDILPPADATPKKGGRRVLSNFQVNITGAVPEWSASSARKKRSPHHAPGHEDFDHDHQSDHHHHHHHHFQSNGQTCSATLFGSFLLPVMSYVFLFLSRYT